MFTKLKNRIGYYSWLLFLGLIFTLKTSAAAQSQSKGLVIGEIRIDRHNVFDRGTELDSKFPYTLANKIHIVTTENFIRSEILFKEGDPFDPIKIKESERRLRSRPVFRYVSVTVAEPLNGKVDIDIRTEDVWTLAIYLSFGTAGGETFYQLGFLERNFLGRGVKAGAFVEKDIDRTTRGIVLHDPHVYDTDIEFTGGYGKDEKGREYELQLARPYRSLYDKQAARGSVFFSDNEDRKFEDGEEVATFRHKFQEERVNYSRSLLDTDLQVYRWNLGYWGKDEEFRDFRFAIPLVLPSERTVSAVLGGFQSIQNRFRKERGVVTIDRDEDLNLGWAWNLNAGPSLEALGATQDGAVAEGFLSKSWVCGGDQFLLTQTDVSGRYEQDRIQNGILKFSGHYVQRDWWKENTATFNTQVRLAHNMDPESEFLLGGENGLRGYSVRQFSGTKSILATLENRRVVLYDWFQVISVGGAVFADTGGTWEEHEKPSFDEFKSDVGFGLRLAPSRSVNPGIIRIDLAYALNDNNRSSPWVINIGGEILFGEAQKRKYDF